MAYLCYRVDILGHTWVVNFLTNKQMEKAYGPRIHAVTDEDDRQIYVRKMSIQADVLLHELMHAWIHEHSATVMGLELHQFEELCCDIVAKYAAKMIEQANQIVHAYKVLRGRRVK